MATKDTGYDFSGLTPRQEEVICFQGWQVGAKYPDGSAWPQPSKRTMKKLIERGLVIERQRQVRAFGGFDMTVTEYEVPIAVHMAWCFSQ